MKFSFTCQFDEGLGNPKNTIEFEAEQLSDVIGYFEQFLRGSGFYFNGQLDFLTDEEVYGTSDTQSSDEGFTMPMPGTIGGATINFMPPSSTQPVTSGQDKCMVRGCGLTRQQLGNHVCYERNCGLK